MRSNRADRRSTARFADFTASTATGLLAAATVGFHIYLIFSGLIPNLVSRPLHLALILPWVFVLGMETTGWRRIMDWSVCAVGLAGCLFIAYAHDALEEQYGALEGWPQRILAVALILIVLEMARRAIRLALPTVAALALAYGLFGQHLPGLFGHAGIPFDSLLGTLVIAEGGLWGPLTGVSVNVVAIFVILGAVIGTGEGGDAFMAMATRFAGGLRAGAAKVSVLSSAFFGSISGSASANVASTGAFTLPAMKRLGYPPAFAAAVEATASTGGQIMPPLMGAGAFIMAELLGITYTRVMGAAVLPAVLFFVAVWIGVDLFARRHGLRAMHRDEIPAPARVAALAPFFLLPFGLLLFVLFALGRTPQYAATLAIFASAALLAVDARWRMSLRRWGARLYRAAVTAARQIAVIGAIIICAGLVIGVLNITGLGVKITSAILALSGGALWAALLLTGLACLILGMEVPTTAAYVICVSVAGPALQELGLPALTAHLFIFWYALLSTITPPVCGTVFIAAGMAEAPWLSVAGHAMRLGLGLYLLPLAFVAQAPLLDPAGMPVAAAAAFLRLGGGLALIAVGVAPAARAAWLRPVWIALGLLLIFAPL